MACYAGEYGEEKKACNDDGDYDHDAKFKQSKVLFLLFHNNVSL